MLWAGIFSGVFLLAVLGVIGLYNGLVRLRNYVRNGWAQIDVQLKRRHDLIPNLLETVKGYMHHERETLEAITAARTAAREAGNPGERLQAEGLFDGQHKQPLPPFPVASRNSKKLNGRKVRKVPLPTGNENPRSWRRSSRKEPAAITASSG